MDIHNQNPLDFNSECCELDMGRAHLSRLIAKNQKNLEALPHSEFVSELIDDLLRHLLSHFSREERLLASISPQNLASQRSAHSELLEQLAEICLGLMQGDKSATDKLHAFLNGMLQQHLFVEAKHYLTNDCSTPGQGCGPIRQDA